MAINIHPKMYVAMSCVVAFRLGLLRWGLSAFLGLRFGFCGVFSLF